MNWVTFIGNTAVFLSAHFGLTLDDDKSLFNLKTSKKGPLELYELEKTHFDTTPAPNNIRFDRFKSS